MYKRLQAMRESDKGFTLIELLIVIIILAVLATIVILSVSGVTNNSKNSACKTSLKTVQTSAEAYYAEKNNDAATLQDLIDAGFLHAPDNYSGNVIASDSSATPDYTITYVPAGGDLQPSGTAGKAGDAYASNGANDGCPT
jgi:prepilin-type N-terminal cleavage/methylation domain-containing protein